MKNWKSHKNKPKKKRKRLKTNNDNIDVAMINVEKITNQHLP